MKNERLDREKQTIEQMVRIHCASQHQSPRLCDDCHALLARASARIDECPFGSSKPVCGRCSTDCFTPDDRLQLRQVMKRSGPRMLLRHPWLTLRHVADALSTRL